MSSRASATHVREAVRELIAQVRSADRGAYLATTLAPARARPGFYVLHAFNAEMATLRKHQSSEIRLQWWAHAIEDCFAGQPPDHPLAHVLAECVDRYGLSQRWFRRLLDAREADMQILQYMKVDDVEAYADRTVGSLLSLKLEVLGVKSAEADHVASHVGKAVGLATLLAGTHRHLEEGHLYIPTTDKAIDFTALRQSGDMVERRKLADAAYELACVAKAHLDHAAGLPCPPEARPAFLQAVQTSVFLDRLQRSDFDVLDDSLLLNPGPFDPFFLHMRMFWAAKVRRKPL